MQAAWKVDLSGNPFMEFHAKLKNVKRVLAELSKQAFGDIFPEGHYSGRCHQCKRIPTGNQPNTRKSPGAEEGRSRVEQA